MSEKVVNARVPSGLYKKISEKARKNSTTISSLLRALLEDSIEVYSDIADVIDEKIKAAIEGDKLVGYQEIVLGSEKTCSGCASKLKKKDKAYVVLTERCSSPKVVVCTKCISSK